MNGGTHGIHKATRSRGEEKGQKRGHDPKKGQITNPQPPFGP
jgi:hypothetical protein